MKNSIEIDLNGSMGNLPNDKTFQTIDILIAIQAHFGVYYQFALMKWEWKKREAIDLEWFRI